MRTLKELSLQGKRVLIRADLNVPLSDQGVITDDNRIKKFLPTLQFVLNAGGRPIVMSHFGDDGAQSLKPVVDKMATLLNLPVDLVADCIGADAERQSQALAPGKVLVLENLRRHAGEKDNSPDFSAALARLGDVYVSDAFATAHRKHASMVGVPKLFKEKAPGLLMQQEMDFYDKAMVKPKHPLCVILGGAKVSSKLNVLMNIAAKADKIIIGGAMANTFLAAQGIQMGRSLVEKELCGKVIELLGILARRDCKLYLPIDFLVSPGLNAKGLGRAVPALEVPPDTMALDIGPATSLLYKEAIQNAETIVWNGPMGAFENEEFAKGTTDMIETLASAHGLTVVGGGDTDAAIHQMQLGHKFDYISTGGGAFLALLEGRGLPGFSALEG